MPRSFCPIIGPQITVKDPRGFDFYIFKLFCLTPHKWIDFIPIGLAYKSFVLLHILVAVRFSIRSGLSTLDKCLANNFCVLEGGNIPSHYRCSQKQFHPVLKVLTGRPSWALFIYSSQMGSAVLPPPSPRPRVCSLSNQPKRLWQYQV